MLLWVSLLGVLVYLLKRTGVIDKIAEVFKEGGLLQIIKDSWELIWSGVKDIVMGVWGVIRSIFDIIVALYSGEGLGDALILIKLSEGFI